MDVCFLSAEKTPDTWALSTGQPPGSCLDQAHEGGVDFAVKKASTWPVSFKPRRRPFSRGVSDSGDPEFRYPITGIVGCCARAASGHTAAPPTSVSRTR